MAVTYALFRSGSPVMADYTPGSAVTAGDVVIVSDLALIAHLDIAANALGSLATGGGIYSMPKASGSITGGVRLFWDATNHVVTTDRGTNKIIGFAGPDGAASADTTVLVIHDPGMDTAGT